MIAVASKNNILIMIMIAVARVKNNILIMIVIAVARVKNNILIMIMIAVARGTMIMIVTIKTFDPSSSLLSPLSLCLRTLHLNCRAFSYCLAAFQLLPCRISVTALPHCNCT